MAVDMNPSEGRICLLRGRSTEVFPWYEKGGKIVRMSGKRAYFIKPDGSETFSHEFSAICDTPEEEAALLKFTAEAKGRLASLVESFHTEAKILESAINAGSAKMKSISKPVARVSRTRHV